MNEIANNFLLAGDKFMAKIHLKQSGFTYSACGPFTKTKKEFNNLKKQEIQDIFPEMNWIPSRHTSPGGTLNVTTPWAYR